MFSIRSRFNLSRSVPDLTATPYTTVCYAVHSGLLHRRPLSVSVHVFWCGGVVVVVVLLFTGYDGVVVRFTVVVLFMDFEVVIEFGC
jgi:hypothetical protein